jgi:acyl-CoA reductase-like NAD-dependent aldehyde dehydrogenase
MKLGDNMSRCFLESFNPADGSLIGTVKTTEIADINLKVDMAKKMFADWGQLSVNDRVNKLAPICEKILSQKDEIALLISQEVGRPIKEAKNEVIYTVKDIKWYLENGLLNLQQEVLFENENVKNIIRREPWGVTVVISPFNVPLEISMWGIISSLVCGNTVIFKPSEYAPLVGQKIYELFCQIGLEAGVIDIVQGDGDVGKYLVESAVDFIWFTGSSKVGTEIYHTAGKKFINCIMELGGSNPTIIFDDVSITDNLVSDICFGRFINCGQICSSIKRLFVHSNIYDLFLEKLVAKVNSLKIGNPLSEDTNIGCLVSKSQLDTLKSQVNDAIQNGAKVECGAKRPEGFSEMYYEPTILTNINTKMRVFREEVFGPVLPIIKFENEDEVINLANDTEYGLAAEIYTESAQRANRMASKIQAGRIAINMPRYADLSCPMGGYKKSGKGRQHGKWIFEELTQIKHIIIKK